MAQLGGGASTVVVRQRLDPHPSSVSQARRLVVRALGDLGRADLADNAALAVSELVTNALVHAGTSIEVVVSEHDAEVVVEVVDDNPRQPVRRQHAELAGTGRGLQLVEQLTTAWGTRDRPPGKAVWFQLGGEPEGGAARDDAARDDADPGDDLDLDALLEAFPDIEDRPEERSSPPHDPEVVLLEVPLLLHAAWQMQAESVLREYLLTRLSGSDDRVEEELEAHAAAHEALVMLQEHVPTPPFDEHSDELLANVVEPLASAAELRFAVPPRGLRNLERLEFALDAATGLAEAGALLTPPTQPEVRAFRRWICREVREQQDGAPPQPWQPDAGQTSVLTLPPPEWDATAVATSAKAVIAAADTSRIVAASPAAVRLLGYADEAGLLGHRIVDIIPARFRQAHLAGFTLHLFAGRAPLIGNRVVVPALRRDGSEVEVDLCIEAVSLPGGRHVFVAELGEPGDTPPT